MKYFYLLLLLVSLVAFADAPIIGGSEGPKFIAPMTIKKQLSRPSTPAPGYEKLYFNDNNKLYRLQSDGSEVLIDLSGNATSSSKFDHIPLGCSLNYFANAIDPSGNLSCGQPTISLLSQVTDVLPIISGGTNNAFLDVTAGGVLATDGSKIISTGAGTSGQYLQSNGTSVGWVTPQLTAPSMSIATGNGVGTGGFAVNTSQQGWLFNISSLSSALTSGAIYTNNGNSYTVLASLASGASGQILFVSGSGSTSGTTLTISSGSGPSTITINQTAPNEPLALYKYVVPTPTPLYLEVEMIGGGGGGGASTTNSGVCGVAGRSTVFGTLFVSAPGGQAGCSGGIGAVGTFNYSVSPWLGGSKITPEIILPGTQGVLGFWQSSGAATLGGSGGNSPFGGAGSGPTSISAGAMTGASAQANSGSGGAGGISNNAAGGAGSGGTSGVYAKFIINKSNLQTEYLYTVGSGGAGGVSSNTGGAGGSGIINVKAAYQ